MKFYSSPLNEVLEKTSTDPKIGLSQKEADLRLSQYGENKLNEKRLEP